MKRQDEIKGAVDVKLFDWQAEKGLWPSPLRTQTPGTVRKDSGVRCENQFQHSQMYTVYICPLLLGTQM